MYVCACMLVFLGWFYTSDFTLFTCLNMNKVSYLIFSYIKDFVSQSICKNLMQKLSYKLHWLGRHAMSSRLTRKYITLL